MWPFIVCIMNPGVPSKNGSDDNDEPNSFHTTRESDSDSSSGEYEGILLWTSEIISRSLLLVLLFPRSLLAVMLLLFAIVVFERLTDSIQYDLLEVSDFLRGGPLFNHDILNLLINEFNIEHLRGFNDRDVYSSNDSTYLAHDCE